MNVRRWRRRCNDIVNALDFPVPFDIDELCRRVSASRGRRLTLRAIAMPDGAASGVWLATDAGDYIFFERKTSRLHQEHIKAHELGHILGGHESPAQLNPHASDTDNIQALAAFIGVSPQALLDEDRDRIVEQIAQLDVPDLDPHIVSRVLHRSHYSTAQERDAETIASLILKRAHRWRSVSEWPTDPATADIRQRLGDVLEPPPS